MSIKTRTLSPSLGVEVFGVNAQEMSLDEKCTVKALFEKHHLVLFRNAGLSEEQHLDIVKAIGPISKSDEIMKDGRRFTLISNVHPDGRLPEGELYYHSDHMFLKSPLKGISLYAIEAPRVGGETRFLNTAKAYAELPADLKKRIEGLSARHVYDYSVNRGDKRPDPSSLSEMSDTAIHPLVWHHPESGMPILFLSQLFTTDIIGLSREESDEILEALFKFLDSRGDDYVHKWSVGDLIIWDNCHRQHARNDFPASERRALRRVPIEAAEFALTA